MSSRREEAAERKTHAENVKQALTLYFMEWDDDDIENEDLTYADYDAIAAEFGKTVQHVKDQARSVPHTKKDRRVRITSKKKEAIIAFIRANNGASDASVAEKFNLTKDQVANIRNPNKKAKRKQAKEDGNANKRQKPVIDVGDGVVLQKVVTRSDRILSREAVLYIMEQKTQSKKSAQSVCDDVLKQFNVEIKTDLVYNIWNKLIYKDITCSILP